METVKEHDRLLRGDGETEGVVHSVRALIEDKKERKALQRTILIGVVALILERIINYIGIALHNT